MRKPVETVADPFAPEALKVSVEASPVASAEGATKRRGWRRLVQVNLLMVLVALAVVSGYFAMRRNLLVPYLEQKEAREHLAIRGAQFSAVPASPKWAQTLFQISDDDFQNVEMIKLENSDGIRDADLIQLHKFPHLRRLYLANTRVTDGGMKHLRYCTKLRRVSLWDTQVGDAGIRELETLQDLRIIDIHRTWTTDAALETLGKLSALEELVLDDATTKRGIAHLAGLKNLRRLNLRSTSLEADCLASLADCPIEILEVTPAFADRETAKNFRHVPRLRALHLSLPGATDEDLEWLGSMIGLRSLELRDLKAEGKFASGVAKMRQLETLTIFSDRLRNENIFALVSPPRLKEATLTARIVQGDYEALPEGPLRITIQSPWHPPSQYDPTRNRRVNWSMASTHDVIEGSFRSGEAETFSNHSQQYVTTDDLAPLLAQKELKTLTLVNWEFAPGALSALAELDRLERISLHQVRYEPGELAALATLPELQFFETRNCDPISEAELAAFVNAPKLAWLIVGQNDLGPGVFLDLLRKESLRRLRVMSTTLDDRFLDEADAILEPRARSGAERTVRKEELIPWDSQYVFNSSAFTKARTQSFDDKFRILVGVVKALGTEVADEVIGAWPHHEPGGRFSWIDESYEAGIELSPLDLNGLEYPAQNGVSSRRLGAFYPFAESGTLSLQHALAAAADGDDSVYRARRNDPLKRRISIRFGDVPSEPAIISLDRYVASDLRPAFEAATAMELRAGALPEGLDEKLAASPAEFLSISETCRFDERLLRSASRMPNLRTLRFNGCRKPTPEEVAVLYESATLRTIEFEHRGEPVYFEEIAGPDRGTNRVLSTGKVVYDAEDAIRERPNSVILANFEEKLWPAILSDRRSITEVRLRDDWPNQLRFHFHLEALRREQEEAAETEEATSEANPANLGKPVKFAF